jgi:predicted transposase/invertase (TIGR01784 family)
MAAPVERRLWGNTDWPQVNQRCPNFSKIQSKSRHGAFIGAERNMVRLNPLNDFMFLKTMGEKGCETQLLSFLNAVLERTGKGCIAGVEIIENTTLSAEALGAKKNILDVRASLADNTKINIEVQLCNKYNMEKRSLYYWSREFYQGIDAGQDYHELPAVIAINILDFGYFRLEEFHTSFHLWEDRDRSYMLTDALEMHFLEIPKFRALRGKDIKNNALHRWLSYFDQRTSEQLIEEIMTMDPVIEKAQAVMDKVSRDEGLRHAYDMYQLSLMDERNIQYRITKAVQEATKKLREGVRDEVREIAARMKLLGDTAEKISEVTGLPVEEIQKL